MKRQKIINAISLLCILGLGIFLFWYTIGNRGVQFLVGVITSIAYVLWGLLHHALEGTLHKKVVVEYLLIGAIAVVLIMTILL